MSPATPTCTDLFLEALARGYARDTRPGESALLAISGGLDSTALLVGSAHVAERAGLRLAVASVDHGLRAAAPGEVARVEALARELALPFFGLAVRVPREGNLEAVARALRYEALERLRAEQGLGWLVTAHTATDQAETLLMRLGRGAALRGARGVLRRRERILRPMLSITREECRAFLVAQGRAWADDPMNRDPAFQRTRIRENALPALVAATSPGAVRRLARFAELASEDEAFIEGLAERALARSRLAGDRVDAASLRALAGPIRRRCLRLWLEELGLAADGELLGRAEAALMGSRGCSLPGRARLSCEGGVLRRVAPASGGPRGGPVVLRPGGRVAFGAWRLWWHDGSGDAPATHAFVARALRGALAVRGRRPGDLIRGPTGSRKVQDLLVDAKVPRELRDGWPILCDAASGEPLWVVGLWPRQGPRGGPCVCAEPVCEESAETPRSL